jgi:hypothetical protein
MNNMGFFDFLVRAGTQPREDYRLRVDPPTPSGTVLTTGVRAGPPAACTVLRVPAEEAGRRALGPAALLWPEGEPGALSPV